MRGVCVVCVRGACVFGKGTINNLYKIKFVFSLSVVYSVLMTVLK